MHHNLYRGPPLSQRTAMARHLREDSTGLSPVWQILAVVVVTGALIGAFYYFYVQHPPPAGGPRRVEPWDTAEIGYVGTFADDGRVFDTAYARVARDNVSYPKAASFSWRAQWTNFSFDVGCADLTPAEQQIKSCTAAIKGFDQGVRGMAVGDTKRIVVPPELGYGASDPSKIFERPLLQEVPARVVMNGNRLPLGERRDGHEQSVPGREGPAVRRLGRTGRGDRRRGEQRDGDRLRAARPRPGRRAGHPRARRFGPVHRDVRGPRQGGLRRGLQSGGRRPDPRVRHHDRVDHPEVGGRADTLGGRPHRGRVPDVGGRGGPPRDVPDLRG
ncbi:MAG: hypothetical protein E6K10_06795 [Methanobacteriota archaeon]|nr:MAG: hypothetical protein E6K10_06795 [Euryarchaeota archaeon]